MIPQEKTDAVNRGLRETFGTAELEQISRITKGRTQSLVFRIVVRGAPWLLKIITRDEDPTRHYTSMKAAADQGLAPRVLYTSVPDRISITDYVEEVPLPHSEALARLPVVLRRLHALPPFDRAPFNTTCTFLLQKNAAQRGFLEKFRTANFLSEAEIDKFFALHEQLAAAYPWDDAEMVASHNDLFKPDNILFDGNRVWLVDWEAAFLNDRYADLAVVANQIATGEEEEKFFLREYFGTDPGEYQLARFHVMRQLTHLFYTMAFLYTGRADTAIDWSRAVPEFADFQRRAWDGEVSLADQDVKITYARVHWERLLYNVRQARYEEAIGIVAGQGRGRHDQ